MADYFPLLARALEALPDPDGRARAAVYERARAALATQLQAVEPRLSEAEIARERASLDEAIGRVEHNYAVAPGPAPEPEIEPAETRRPRLDTPQPIRRGGRSRGPLILAVGLVAVIAPMAVLAWLWRDQPASTQATEPARPTAPSATAPSPGDPKFPERVAGGAAPQPAAPAAHERPSPQPSTPAATAPQGRPAPAAPPSAQAPPAQPDVAVAQKAALVEENQGDPQQPKVTPGRALWRLDALNAGQGQPLETVIRANVDIPDAGLSMLATMRRNRDTTLPASHTIELTFTTTRAEDGSRVVRDVNPPLARGDDGARGMPLAALAVPVKENVFLIGLSDLRADVERNTELLTKRNWIELPLRFASGVRATIVFEKGVPGDRVIADAFRQWGQP